MKLMSTLAIVAVSIALAFSALNAEAAKRMGGGKSMGQQSQNVTNRQATAPSAAPLTRCPQNLLRQHLLRLHLPHQNLGAPCWVA
jgi:hypothetical protein